LFNLTISEKKVKALFPALGQDSAI
jgi:hypothetical protein